MDSGIDILPYLFVPRSYCPDLSQTPLKEKQIILDFLIIGVILLERGEICLD